MEAYRGPEQEILSSILRREIITILRSFISRAEDNPLLDLSHKKPHKKKLQELTKEFEPEIMQICILLSNGTLSIKQLYSEVQNLLGEIKKRLETENELLNGIERIVEECREKIDTAAVKIKRLLAGDLNHDLDDQEIQWKKAIEEITRKLQPSTSPLVAPIAPKIVSTIPLKDDPLNGKNFERFIQQIPPAEQQIFSCLSELPLGGGLTISQLSQKMGCTPMAVRSTLNRIQRRINAHSLGYPFKIITVLPAKYGGGYKAFGLALNIDE